ncbi:hypothetical protein KUF71_014190 [Frankliniella fusca]|uniref:Uncharacterized protein n=1 Tax=Frankliniella fusca TaxID=407009 RepID=A0AAE1LMP4_9NEOP|nr:hypothetical protein KUF71_014190 [Frankliniella fusca]
MESLLNYDTPAKNSHMGMRMWYKDTAGEFNTLTTGKNSGLDKRRELTGKSKPFQLLGPLHCDFFSQSKFLLNNVELKVKLTRARDAFTLMSTKQDEKIVILDATLLVRKVKIAPTVLLAHAAALEKAPARYPLTRVDVKCITIPNGLRDKSIPNLHMGQIPKRMVIGFVTNQAYNGSYRHNPFNYEHFDLNYLALYVDGEQIPAVPPHTRL